MKPHCGYCDREHTSCQCYNEVEDKPVRSLEINTAKYVHKSMTIDEVKKEIEKINEKYKKSRSILIMILLTQFTFIYWQVFILKKSF